MNRRAFTLIELLLVVAIVGLLVTMALPHYFHLQYRAKRAELAPNVVAIRDVELFYGAQFDRFLAQPERVPRAVPGPSPVPWERGSNFDELGWLPDGSVRGVYSVQVAFDQAGSSEGDFLVEGAVDLDGDGREAIYTATRSISTTFINNHITY